MAADTSSRERIHCVAHSLNQGADKSALPALATVQKLVRVSKCDLASRLKSWMSDQAEQPVPAFAWRVADLHAALPTSLARWINATALSKHAWRIAHTQLLPDQRKTMLIIPQLCKAHEQWQR